MEDRRATVPCPFCGGQTGDLSKAQVALLRAAMMSDIVPALLHSMQHEIVALSANHSFIQMELKKDRLDDRIQKIFNRDEQNLKQLEQYFRTLRHLFRPPDDDRIISLHDLPDQISWLWGVFEIRNLPDTSTLNHSKKRIRYAPYWDTLTLGVHAALISLRRDRNPTFEVSFKLNKEQLITKIEMNYSTQIDTSSPQWDGFRSAVNHAGGSHQFTASKNNTVVEWHIPFLK